MADETPAFRQCASCAARPGETTNCEVCLHNRDLAEQLAAYKRAAVYWQENAQRLEKDVAALAERAGHLRDELAEQRAPIPMLLWCPECGERHVDPPGYHAHDTHACQICGHVWRPAMIATTGVRFLPGLKHPEEGAGG